MNVRTATTRYLIHLEEIGQGTVYYMNSVSRELYASKCYPCMTGYERSWNKLNKTKLLQDALERAGRKDLADKLRCLHWGHQKLSNRVELPSAFPFLITVHKTINNRDGLKKINELSRRYT
ncbi:hypothetical protein EOD39_13632 [Acipenser ruthenus]|uniref:Uncharacterized protein n=1 Tax=Acipenser ruthenus TaxID=7906 RepID=A0A662YPH5_ACIRT|nr:hypothetical protein EOD39_13632 [Acipenser ruthenus]